MVYRGKPSRGCKECRSMKIRCGQQTPDCMQCVKGKRHCSGYRDQLDLMFLDESSSTRRKAGARDDSSKNWVSAPRANLLVPYVSGSESSSRSISPPGRLLHLPLADQAVAFFFANYADISPKNIIETADFSTLIYQRDQPDGPVRTIVQALGLGGLSTVAKDTRMRNAAISTYISAMSKTNAALRNSKTAKDDNTLFSILSLAVFETITCGSPQPIVAFTKHIRGIITLLELRGPDQLLNEVGLQMFLRIRGHLIVTCLQYYIPIPSVFLRWSELLDNIHPDLQPDNKLAAIAIEFTDVRADVQTGKCTDLEYIVSRLLEIEDKLNQWKVSLPSSWKYWEYPIATPSDEVLGLTSLDYRDIWTCSIYGKWRCFRIFLHEMLIDCLTRSKLSNVGLSPKPNTDGHLQASRVTLQVLAFEVAASIPYMLGYRKGIKPSLQDDVPAIAGMLCCWPLFVIGGMVGASDAVRAWSMGRLLSIGADMGIYQALLLAGVLRKKQDISYWKDRLAHDPIEETPPEDEIDCNGGYVPFKEGSRDWMNKSDLTSINEKPGRL